jgi:hypothetical protein
VSNLKQVLSLSLLALGMALPAAAQTPGKGGWVFKLGAEFGGDEVAKVYFSDGSTQSINAGQGLSLGVGGHYSPAGTKWDFNGTVGFKYTSTKGRDASINMNRTELEFRADRFLEEGWWIGAGPVIHTGTRFSAGGFAPNVDFDSATGLTAKVGWKWVALSYTGIKYKSEFGQSVDASNFGIVFFGRF